VVRDESRKVAIFGLGYVGCVTAACLARLGHHVTGVDRDVAKVQSVQAGLSPFYEPGLQDLVTAGVEAGLLAATTEWGPALADADVALVCVGTPSERNGNLGLDQLRRTMCQIRDSLAGRTKRLTVAIRSTVFPGTCEELTETILGGHPGVRVVCNPEFLREGCAVVDFMQPSLIVVGGADADAVHSVARLYSALKVEPALVSLRTAELIKYACNAFHAVKICFANEIGTLAASLDVSAEEVMQTLCADGKLNTSAAYLKPGFAFGGSCLPKDIRALNYRASRLDLQLALLESTLPSNQQHLMRAINRVLDLPVERIGMIGLAFKENTDDLRESPAVALLEHLIGKGRNVRVYDSHIQLHEIYGSNRNFILDAVPHIGRLLTRTPEDLLGWAEYLVITQRPSPALQFRIDESGLPVLDLTSSHALARSAVAVGSLV
jgi:GDP-mannose 6-dehydrogenase